MLLLLQQRRQRSNSLDFRVRSSRVQLSQDPKSFGQVLRPPEAFSGFIQRSLSHRNRFESPEIAYFHQGRRGKWKNDQKRCLSG